MPPVLALLNEGEKTTPEIVEAISHALSLSPEERAERLANGQTLIGNRVYWALVKLGQQGAIEKLGPGRYRAATGEARLLAPSAGNTPRPSATSPSAASPSDSDSLSPDEMLARATNAIEAEVRRDLAQRIAEKPSQFLEQMVLDLLDKMEYGRGHGTRARRLGGAGDQGLDGVVFRDPLGLDELVIQTKRFGNNAVTPDQVRDFAGAVAHRGGKHGVFVTTSRFTEAATQFALHHRAVKLVLIDGDRLVDLCLQYGVGVERETVEFAGRVDLNYFDPDTST